MDEVWSGPAVLALNPSWADPPGTLSEHFRQLVDSFVVAYSFMPVSVKVSRQQAVCVCEGWSWACRGA